MSVLSNFNDMSKVTYLSLPLISLCFLTLQRSLLRPQQVHGEQLKRTQPNHLTMKRFTTKRDGMESDRREIEEIGGTRAVSGSNSRHGGKKDGVDSPWRPWSIPFYQRVGPQWWSSLPWNVLVLFWQILFFSLNLDSYTRTFLHLYLPVGTSWEIIFKFPSLRIFIVTHALNSLSGYQYPEVHSWVFQLTPDTTEP